MKRTARLLCTLSMLPLLARSQSTMEFQSGTTIEVQTGADICADNVIIDGTYTGGGTKCGGALPVELQSINTQISKTSVTLTWTSITETNDFSFEIERQKVASDQAPWQSIGVVQASGTSSSSHKYTYVDNGLSPGKYEYRLKQIDRDGTLKYYDIQKVEILAPKEFSMEQNFPNPFNPTTTIQYAVPTQAHVLIAVYNTLGQKVAELVNTEEDAGYYSAKFDATRLASGSYIYRIEGRPINGGGTASFVQTKKLIVVK